ncbi:MAG: hypothetical protein HN919_04185 [Verrucomicrobia bacterium]|nr:hypothetical protein [Verrucomicrobiota bacterium]MBT7065476.1 hypothetical protein [Verrucomicrobiota bacterium]MBT7699360.1 hypothetical protein [Verrucomicrobiota bacterium]
MTARTRTVRARTTARTVAAVRAITTLRTITALPAFGTILLSTRPIRPIRPVIGAAATITAIATVRTGAATGTVTPLTAFRSLCTRFTGRPGIAMALRPMRPFGAT